MLHEGDKIGLCACSNALQPEKSGEMESLRRVLCECSLIPTESPCLYGNGSVFSGTAQEKASALMEMYKDDSIKAIFDVSGGDLANEILDLLDYDQMIKHPKPFWGYSDLTTVMHAIYTQTGHTGYLYQIRNLVREEREEQQENFKRSLLAGKDDLYQIHWDFLRGNYMEGIVVGGDIRCFLKLAGTPYFPDFRGKILFLESFSSTADRVTACLSQLRQMGVFSQLSGLLLGTFTQMERTNETPTAPELVLQSVNRNDLPIAVTHQVGHGADSKCLKIGEHYTIGSESAVI